MTLCFEADGTLLEATIVIDAISGLTHIDSKFSKTSGGIQLHVLKVPFLFETFRLAFTVKAQLGGQTFTDWKKMKPVAQLEYLKLVKESVSSDKCSAPKRLRPTPSPTYLSFGSSASGSGTSVEPMQVGSSANLSQTLGWVERQSFSCGLLCFHDSMSIINIINVTISNVSWRLQTKFRELLDSVSTHVSWLCSEITLPPGHYRIPRIR